MNVACEQQPETPVSASGEKNAFRESAPHGLAQRVEGVYFRRTPSERKVAKSCNARSIVNFVGSVVFFFRSMTVL
jgi:hypothetical protein